MYYVYLLQNRDREIYIGCTNDLRRRLEKHNKGKVFATHGSIWRLIYYEAYLLKSDAFRREQRLKDYGQALRQLRDRLHDSLSGKS